MKGSNGRIYIESLARFSPYADGVDFTDLSEINFHMSIKTLVRLYEGTKFQMEKNGINWDTLCDELFARS